MRLHNKMFYLWLPRTAKALRRGSRGAPCSFIGSCPATHFFTGALMAENYFFQAQLILERLYFCSNRQKKICHNEWSCRGVGWRHHLIRFAMMASMTSVEEAGKHVFRSAIFSKHCQRNMDDGLDLNRRTKVDLPHFLSRMVSSCGNVWKFNSFSSVRFAVLFRLLFPLSFTKC